MAISGVLGRSNLFGLELRAEPTDEIYAGIETLVTVRLRNRRRWLTACLLRLDLAGGAAACPVLPPAASCACHCRLPFPAAVCSRWGRFASAPPFRSISSCAASPCPWPRP